jgi:hypothetical protein
MLGRQGRAAGDMIETLLIIAAFFVGTAFGCWAHARWQHELAEFEAMYPD